MTSLRRNDDIISLTQLGEVGLRYVYVTCTRQKYFLSFKRQYFGKDELETSFDQILAKKKWVHTYPGMEIVVINRFYEIVAHLQDWKSQQSDKFSTRIKILAPKMASKIVAYLW